MQIQYIAKDLPGVGKNMRSHVGAGGIYFTTTQPVGLSLFRDLSIRSLASYAFRGGSEKFFQYSDFTT